MRRTRSFRRDADGRTKAALAVGAWTSSATVLFIGVFIFLKSLPALQNPGIHRFFTDAAWRPTGDAGSFGMLPMLAGSLAITLLAVAIAAPLGILSALYARYYVSPPLTRFLRLAWVLLAGIPSVVFGLWGLVTLVPLVRVLQPPGYGLATGALVLSVMILPSVAITADAAFGAVPPSNIRGAYALGLRRWSMIRLVVLRHARGGLAAGVLLSAAPAIGETMAVVMVCGNISQWPSEVFQPIRTITASIALEMGYATATHRSVLFACAFCLLVVVAALTFISLPGDERRDAS